MSYSSRVYRQRNAHSYDEKVKEPFFAKQNDTDKTNSFFQTKVSSNEAGDKYEREADSVAKTVVSHPEKTPVVPQKNGEPEKDKMKGIHKKDNLEKKEKEKKKTTSVQAKQDAAAGTAPTHLSSTIENTTGHGNSLPQKTLHEMSSSFGVDLSNVRIHHDSKAAAMAKELNAQAFTHGSDIYFNEGKYDPNSSAGKFLLAHELTHVVQQETFADNGIQKSPAVAVAIGAAVVAAVLCSYAFFEYALSNFPDKNDKWKHCWVSCKITAWCGGDAIALIIGAGKEGLDAICDAYGKGCKAEFMDFLADVEGIGCANVPLLPCTTCCDNIGVSAL